MKRTLVTARLPLLLPLLLLLLLTAGSLGCKAAALPLSAPVAAAMAEEGLTVNPSTIQHFSVRKNGTTRLRDVPPLAKGRCFIPSGMKQRGNTPRKRGVYCHCRDSTSEVNDTPKRMKRRGESLISPALDRGGRRRAAAAPGPSCRLPATAKTADGGRAVRGCPRGWKPADKHRY